jgi:hypothetical protein
VFGLEKLDEKFCTSSTKAVRQCNDTMKTKLKVLKTACSTIFLKLVGNGLQQVFKQWVVERSNNLHHFSSEVFGKGDSHCTSTKFRLEVIR